MAVTAGDIVRVTVNSILPGPNTAQNIHYYLAGSGYNETEANTVNTVGAQADAAYALLNSIISNAVNPGGVDVAVSTDGGSTFNAIGTYVPSTYSPAAATQMLPHGAAAIVRFQTDGLGEQGRKFIGGIVEGNQTESNLDAGAIAALINFGNSLNNLLVTGTGTLMPGWYSVVNTAFRPYSNTYVVNAVIGYQRRRKPGVGI
jgi:hypothetical protein